MEWTKVLLTAAIGGLMAGATACDKGDAKAAAAETPRPAASAAPAATPAATPAAVAEKHACKGQNDCKGQGGCKTDKHGCKGQNDCKGQGGCKGA